MSKSDELNVSVLLFLENICYWSHSGPSPNAICIRGCCVSHRAWVVPRARRLLAVGRPGGKSTLQNIYGPVNQPHSPMVPALCEEKRERGSLAGGLVHGHGGCCRQRAGSIAACRPRVPKAAAQCRLLPGIGAPVWLWQIYVDFQLINCISYLGIQSVSEAFSYFSYFLVKT